MSHFLTIRMEVELIWPGCKYHHHYSRSSDQLPVIAEIINESYYTIRKSSLGPASVSHVN